MCITFQGYTFFKPFIINGLYGGKSKCAEKWKFFFFKNKRLYVV